MGFQDPRSLNCAWFGRVWMLQRAGALQRAQASQRVMKMNRAKLGTPASKLIKAVCFVHLYICISRRVIQRRIKSGTLVSLLLYKNLMTALTFQNFTASVQKTDQKEKSTVVIRVAKDAVLGAWSEWSQCTVSCLQPPTYQMGQFCLL